MSQSLRKMEYAVRGDVVIRAEEIEQQLASGRGAELPFDRITFTNIGNPQAVGQRPLTFFRQVLALCDLPPECGVDHPDATALFPRDAIERAREMRKAMGEGGMGAYSSTQGVRGFRDDVARFISKRDGHVCDPGDIFLQNGASSAIGKVLTTIVSGPDDSVLLPVPQYPIYSGLVSLLGAHQQGYLLDESRDWAVTEEALQGAVDEARALGKDPRACVLINPGNPTGQVFSRATLEGVVDFCVRERLVLLADEVYQENIYTGGEGFVSCRQVALDKGATDLELISFHSTSKGLLGECGRRGGYMDLLHIDPYVRSQLFKLSSSSLCASLPGQALTALMVRPPQPGDESHPTYQAEVAAIREGLARKSRLLVDGLRSIPGFSCNDARGAMYAFPAVEMPRGAHEAAAQRGVTPDDLYALSLLESTGICVVPASGFGQAPGRTGFRTTFLPPEETLRAAVESMRAHHLRFCERYGG